MKILLHQDPFPGITSKIYFNDGRTRYYTESESGSVRVDYENFRSIAKGSAPLLECTLLVCGTFFENHYDKRLNQSFCCVEHVLEGAMYVRCDRMIYLVEAGDIVIMPPHQDYEFRPAGESVRKLGIIMKGSLLEGALVSSGIARAMVFTPETPLREEMMDAVESLRAEMERNAPDSVTGAAVFRILALLAKMRKKDCPEERFAQLQQYVDNHMRVRDVLRKCCENFGLSPYLLRKSFLTALHTTPKAYLAALRMNRAAEMLMNGRSIKEVADRCGYDSSLNFSTAFRNWHHLPPGKYRKQHS